MERFSEDIIKLFEIFKEETGKYKDLNLEKVEFEGKELKEIAEKIKAGGTPSTSNPEYWHDNFEDIDNENFFGWRDINKDLFSKMYIDKYAKVITKKGYKKSSTWLVPENSILLAIASNSKGLLTISKVPMCINQNILGIVIDHSKYDVRYVYFFLKNHYSKLTQKGFGNLTKRSESKVKVLVPKPLRNYTSYDIQKAIADFIEFVTLKSEEIQKLMDEIISKTELLRKNLLIKLFTKLPNKKKNSKKYLKDVIKLFELFKEETGKYNDLDLRKVEFREVYIFKEIEDQLIPVSALNLKHDVVREFEESYKQNNPDLELYPVYSASANPIGYLPEEYAPSKLVVSNKENPDISFATDGNASAGTNFIIHYGKYYINNTRKVIKFNEGEKQYYTKYLYFTLQDMKKTYNFNRDHKATSENLKQVKISIPKPLGDYSSYDIQKAIADFVEFINRKLDFCKEFAEAYKLKSIKFNKLLLRKIFG